MEKEFRENELSFKKVFQSFKYWPKILRLLYDIDKKRLIGIMLLNIVAATIPAINLLVTQSLINSVVTASESNNISLVVVPFIQLISLGIVGNLINIIKKYNHEMYQKILTYDINVKIMKKSSRLTLGDFDNSKTYDMLQRAQKEAGYRPFEIAMSILGIISSFVTLVTSALILVLWKWWVACLLIFIPVLSTVSLLKQGQREFLVQWERAPESRKSWYITFLLTRDITFKEIKLYNLGSYLIEKYRGIFRGFLQKDRELVRKRSFLTLIFDLINQLVIAFVTGTIIIATIAGEIMVGNLVGYIKAVALTQSNSIIILNTIFKMYQNNLYIRQLFEFLELKESEEENIISNKKRMQIKDIYKIQFKDVSFKYGKSEKYALKNISFEINKNENIAIVGENGSGKTTLVKLLTGLYKPTEGEIFINDIPIDGISIVSMRKRIGVVLQDFIKYELPVRENIGFGELDLIDDDRELMKAAYKANADNIIEDLPKKMDNQLGVWFDGGTQLSGGQWQKIALARAFLRDSSLYILDEPTAALDPLSERELFNKFHELTSNKIGIFISHRFSTVKNASKILVFNEGEIIEVGTHDELMSIDKHYSQLYNIQAEPYK